MTIERALISDLDGLLALMRQYYAYDRLEFDPERARSAMMQLLGTPEYGAVWLLRDGTRIAGYLALCLGYSLEAGGRDAFLDEVFVMEPFRNRGWGSKLVETAVEAAVAAGVYSVHLTVEQSNSQAMRLYRRHGFEPRRSTMLTKKC
ncbi:MAG: GNAT family N-acetyltransferase [Acidobacteria bacterium]|nr:GNAT family N-acetyltransferase [Acidobacteriota bacterium]